MTSRRCGCEWNAWEFAAEVGGIALPVLWVVQDGVDVVTNIIVKMRRPRLLTEALIMVLDTAREAPPE